MKLKWKYSSSWSFVISDNQLPLGGADTGKHGGGMVKTNQTSVYELNHSILLLHF